MYCRDVYRFRDPDFRPRPGMFVVDLGANAGLFSLYAAISGANVLAVEAQSGFAPTFDELMERNGVADRVTLVHALVGWTTGVLADADRRAAATHWGSEPPRPQLSELFDDHVPAEREIDLVKIDIEGSEYDLFADSSWLSRVRRLVMEAHDGFGNPEDLVSTLTRSGFAVRRADADLRTVRELHTTGLVYAVRRLRN